MRFSDRLRLWTMLNQSPIALTVILLCAACGASILVGGMLWAFQEQGPSTQIEGVVESFGMEERDQGSYRVMVVHTGEDRITVRAPVRRSCHIGDRAVLAQKPIRAGAIHSLKSCHPA